MVTLSDKSKIIHLYEFRTVEEFMSSPMIADIILQAREQAEADISRHRQMSVNEVRQILGCGYDTVKKLIAEGKLWVNADGVIPYSSLIEYTNAGKTRK